MKTISPPVTNVEVGRRIGVDPSLASLYRHGKRLPSLPVLMAIFKEFKVPEKERTKLMRVINAGTSREEQLVAFAEFMEKNVYSPRASKSA